MKWGLFDILGGWEGLIAPLISAMLLLHTPLGPAESAGIILISFLLSSAQIGLERFSEFKDIEFLVWPGISILSSALLAKILRLPWVFFISVLPAILPLVRSWLTDLLAFPLLVSFISFPIKGLPSILLGISALYFQSRKISFLVMERNMKIPSSSRIDKVLKLSRISGILSVAGCLLAWNPLFILPSLIIGFSLFMRFSSAYALSGIGMLALAGVIGWN